MTHPPRFSVRVPLDALGTRVDRFLVELTGEASEPLITPLSRAQWQRLIAEGHVRVETATTKPSHKLRGGEEITVELPSPKPTDLIPTPMDLDILFEDGDLVVINKPVGLVVHPGAGHLDHTLVHGLLAHCRDLSGIGGAERPGIVHRLDRGTSGVMVVAKSDRAHLSLAAQFSERRVRKRYLAFVMGTPRPREQTLDTPFGRHPTDRKRFSSRVSGGRRASTTYRVRSEAGGVAQVELDLHTGRTHQIRVHMADLGHPVVGDPLYGGRRWARLPEGPVRQAAEALPSQALHAQCLTFQHPVSGKEMRLVAPLPAHLTHLSEAMASLHEL